MKNKETGQNKAFPLQMLTIGNANSAEKSNGIIRTSSESRELFKVNISDLAEYAYCPRRFYLSRVKRIYKEGVYSILGRLEHDARRVLYKALKHQYRNLTENGLEKHREVCFRIINETLNYVKNIAYLEYPIYSPDIDSSITEISYRLKKEEEERLQRAIELIARGIVGWRLVLSLLPWGVELPLFSNELGLQGRVDQVFLNEDQMIPVDVKTTPYSFIYKDAYAVQIAGYGLLLKKQFRKKVDRGRIYYARSFLYDDVPLTDRLCSRVFEIKDSIQRLQDEREVPPRLGEQEELKCRYCHLQKECYTLNTSEGSLENTWIDRLFHSKVSGNLSTLYSGVS